MRSLVAILVLLLWQLNWILPIVAAPLPDALMVESQDISSDNVTQVTELVQRMEPIAANIDNLVYEVAKNRGARFLEMLLASSPQERADLATEYKEPYRIIDDHASDTLVGTNRKAPAGIETWSVEDTTDEIAITVQGHEDVITKTCPTWNVAARKTTKSVTKPAVRQFIYTRKVSRIPPTLPRLTNQFQVRPLQGSGDLRSSEPRYHENNKLRIDTRGNRQ